MEDSHDSAETVSVVERLFFCGREIVREYVVGTRFRVIGGLAVDKAIFFHDMGQDQLVHHALLQACREPRKVVEPAFVGPDDIQSDPEQIRAGEPAEIGSHCHELQAVDSVLLPSTAESAHGVHHSGSRPEKAVSNQEGGRLDFPRINGAGDRDIKGKRVEADPFWPSVLVPGQDLPVAVELGTLSRGIPLEVERGREGSSQSPRGGRARGGAIKVVIVGIEIEREIEPGFESVFVNPAKRVVAHPEHVLRELLIASYHEREGEGQVVGGDAIAAEPLEEVLHVRATRFDRWDPRGISVAEGAEGGLGSHRVPLGIDEIADGYGVMSIGLEAGIGPHNESSARRIGGAAIEFDEVRDRLPRVEIQQDSGAIRIHRTAHSNALVRSALGLAAATRFQVDRGPGSFEVDLGIREIHENRDGRAEAIEMIPVIRSDRVPVDGGECLLGNAHPVAGGRLRADLVQEGHARKGESAGCAVGRIAFVAQGKMRGFDGTDRLDVEPGGDSIPARLEPLVAPGAIGRRIPSPVFPGLRCGFTRSVTENRRHLGPLAALAPIRLGTESEFGQLGCGPISIGGNPRLDAFYGTRVVSRLGPLKGTSNSLVAVGVVARCPSRDGPRQSLESTGEITGIGALQRGTAAQSDASAVFGRVQRGHRLAVLVDPCRGRRCSRAVTGFRSPLVGARGHRRLSSRCGCGADDTSSWAGVFGVDFETDGVSVERNVQRVEVDVGVIESKGERKVRLVDDGTVQRSFKGDAGIGCGNRMRAGKHRDDYGGEAHGAG